MTLCHYHVEAGISRPTVAASSSGSYACCARTRYIGTRAALEDRVLEPITRPSLLRMAPLIVQLDHQQRRSRLRLTEDEIDVEATDLPEPPLFLPIGGGAAHYIRQPHFAENAIFALDGSVKRIPQCPLAAAQQMWCSLVRQGRLGCSLGPLFQHAVDPLPSAPPVIG